MRKLKVAISTCPNDTFMFEALYNKRIDMKSVAIDWHFADIEELNQRAQKGESDITKISFNALFGLNNTYSILNSGAALGFNCGPQIIARETFDVNELKNKKIAIPGKNTTANLLLSTFFSEIILKEEMIFSNIENAIINSQVDAGLIIHESRFTYQNKGLVKIIDLGEYWEKQYRLPLPLGAIAAKKDLDIELRKDFNQLLKESIIFAFENRQVSIPFIREKAQELDENVIAEHINLYVNKYSIDLGIEGKNAIEILFNHAKKLGLSQNEQLEYNDIN